MIIDLVAEGKPEPDVDWYFNDKIINLFSPFNDNSSETGSILNKRTIITDKSTATFTEAILNKSRKWTIKIKITLNKKKRKAPETKLKKKTEL